MVKIVLAGLHRLKKTLRIHLIKKNIKEQFKVYSPSQHL